MQPFPRPVERTLLRAVPRAEPGGGAVPRAEPAHGDPGSRVARASLWTVSSMVAMSALRLGSQMVLSYLCLPAHFGAIALMRTFLTLVEMLSDFGVRSAVLYHPQGEDKRFLDTAWTVQLLRGGGMWLLTCALAWPAAAFYHEPLLLWLLPVAGFESVQNGLLCVRVYCAERRLELAIPTLLDALGLVVSVVTSIAWACFDPSAWALAAGPLAGGFARAVVSHWLYRATPPALGWDPEHTRSLFAFGRWVIGGTMVSFVAQQFHVLYLGKFLPLALLGVYQVAWNFCAQASKPLTVLANRVIIPHYAEFQRRGRADHSAAVRASLAKFLPACLLVCVSAGLFAPALFGFFYERSFVSGGRMGQLLAVVVWFMVLQHVPRSALLSLGASREVAGMALWNAGLTVVGIVAGYSLGGGSVPGAIWGNALGNVAGCVCGWRAMRRRELEVGRPMLSYSLAFLGLSLGGALSAAFLEHSLGLSERLASAGATVLCALPLAVLVWRRTVLPVLEARRSR